MSRAPYRALTLAIHPNSRGFGWIALSGPFSPYDWGTVGVRGRDKNVRCLRHIEKLLDQLTPETVVLEAFDARNSKRRTRIANLGHAIVALAQGRIIDVAVYTFKDVQGVFADLGDGARTVRHVRGVAEVDDRFRRQLIDHCPGDGQATGPGVEDPDRGVAISSGGHALQSRT